MIRVVRLIVLVLGVTTLARPALAQAEFTDRFSRTVHLDPNGTLDLTNVSGNVVVTGGTGRDVTIDAVKRAPRRPMLQMIDIQIAEQGNRVDVRTVVPRPRNFPGSVDYTIAVPADARVTLRTTTGAIRTTNVAVDTLKVVSGDIEVTDGSAADFFTASSVSGTISIRRLKAQTMQVNTVSGAVHLENVRAARIMARAVSGDIEYAGDLAADGRYEFVSHAGNIRLTLPAASGFDVQANTFSGSVRSDFAVTRRGAQGGEGRSGVTARGLRGVVGDAGAMLVLRAFSGDITIARR